MTQTAAHRLVTEAAAAATYRTAAQVTAEATAQATAAAAPKLNAATYTAEKGAANGIATLGSDGKLSAAQMPATSGPLTVVRTTDLTRTSSTITNDPTLVLPALTAGLYRIELGLVSPVAGTAAVSAFRLGSGSGDPAPAIASNMGTGTFAQGSAAPINWTPSVAQTVSPGNFAHVVGFIRLSTTGALTLVWGSNTNGSVAGLAAGSYMRAERMGG